jgi:hypothetical protein
MQTEINAEIDHEIAFAKARWGETFELKCLEGSRNGILDDQELLRMLRYFWLHGTVYAYILARSRVASKRRGPPPPSDGTPPVTAGRLASGLSPVRSPRNRLPLVLDC